jgi:hypothetical protein
VATFTPATVRNFVPDDEEVSIALTPKGISNNIMASPTNSPKRRRCPTKKASPTVAAKTARNSQASRKRTLDEYQNQLMARPAIPVYNQFITLRIVAKNSGTCQLCQAWEVPKPALRPAPNKDLSASPTQVSSPCRSHLQSSQDAQTKEKRQKS